MRAILCHAFEGADTISLGEAAEPQPAADEVLIDVYAARVNYMECLMTRGGDDVLIVPPLFKWLETLEVDSRNRCDTDDLFARSRWPQHRSRDRTIEFGEAHRAPPAQQAECDL